MSVFAEALKSIDKQQKEKRKQAGRGAGFDLQDIWHNCRLYVRAQSGQLLYPVVMERTEQKYGYSLLLHLPVGLSDIHFRARLHSIAWALGGDIELEALRGKLYLKVLTGEIKNFYKYKDPFQFINGKVAMPVPVGYGREGLIILDIANAPHLLVGGGSGGGKSNWIHQAICTLLAANVNVYIIDLKRLEFAWYNQHATCVHTEKGALQVLQQVEAEMDRRMALLENKVVKVQDWKGPEELPYIVVFIDEIAELQDEKAWGILNRLVRLARALGISIVAATQRPSTKTIDGDTRALFTARLSFRVADRKNSEIIIDGPAASYLPTLPGRAIFRHGNKAREVQTMFLQVPEGLLKVLSKIPARKQAEQAEKLEPAAPIEEIKTKP